MTSQGSSWHPSLGTERPSRHSKSLNLLEKGVEILKHFVGTSLFEQRKTLILCCASNLALQATSFKSTSLDPLGMVTVFFLIMIGQRDNM